ncbi:MAG: undecaprenyl/decaprenyl-phosphate alpha-N-acetylglucosaminyl 1-phosphate transferase, partial [Bacteroides sp.]|nr:undecaprenyl/decaprenyl-phosphate alpha-N-acetylglucosaminyl 1-phosphate transferase [Bacteroides sp.]
CIFSGINILLVSYMNNTLILLGDVVVWMGLNLWWSRVRDTKCRK